MQASEGPGAVKKRRRLVKAGEIGSEASAPAETADASADEADKAEAGAAEEGGLEWSKEQVAALQVGLSHR